MESLLPLIVQLLSGAAGGNIAGAFMNKASLGTLGNSIVGIVGGGIGGQILSMVGVASTGGGMDLTGILGTVASGSIGGGVLLAIIGLIRGALSK